MQRERDFFNVCVASSAYTTTAQTKLIKAIPPPAYYCTLTTNHVGMYSMADSVVIIICGNCGMFIYYSCADNVSYIYTYIDACIVFSRTVYHCGLAQARPNYYLVIIHTSVVM